MLRFASKFAVLAATTALIAAPGERPPVRAHHALVYHPALERVLLTGGSTPLDGGRAFEFYDDVWSFDGSRWEKIGHTGDQRSGARLVFDSHRGGVLSFGGFANGMSLGDLLRLDALAWKKLSDEPAMAAAEAGVVYDTSRDRVVAFGGSPGRGRANGTTWEWDGQVWQANLATGPEARQAFAMIYDVRRTKTVVFGGMGATPQQLFGDTWEFDGKQWTKVATTGPSPSARMAPGFAYDAKRGVCVIFGGMADGRSLGDTWAWDGREWKLLAESGPAPRAMGYLAYDEARDRIVLFGGRCKWPNDANDTWEWDGAKWTEIP
ncbi:MAG: hypothetical protein C0518_08690 [Opitutus sp.]|nr:hypothetical protein [Opitutus sp.]